MKPILTWYDQLPEPIRSQAIENYDADYANYHNKSEETDSDHEAIASGFYWGLTKQGYRYWNDIHDRAAKGEFDIP